MEFRQHSLSPLLFFLVLFFLFPFASFAAHSCTIAPFSKSIQQGDSVSFTVKRNTASSSAPFALTLGDFPIHVAGGFDPKGASSTEEFILVLVASTTAQTGNVGMVLLMSEESDEKIIHKSVCQLSLSISAHVPGGMPSKDALQSIPPNLLLGVGPLAALPAANFPKDTPQSSFDSPAPSVAISLPEHNFTFRLARGDHNKDVTVLQKILKLLDFFPKEVPETGYFGSITKSAVIAFQKAHNIDPIGIVGPKTRKALNELRERSDL